MARNDLIASEPPASKDRYWGLFENSPVSLWEEDFSELKVHLEQLERSNVGDLRRFFRNCPEEVYRCASLVKVVDVNRATLELLECDRKERLLGSLPVFFRERSYELFLEEIVALAEGKTVFEADAISETLKGRQIAVKLRLSIAPGCEQTWSKVFASVTDMSEWRKAETELVRLAQFDSLTELPNRATFNDRLTQEALRINRRGGAVAVLMLDLDNFKDINDAFGHPVGDAFLVAVAKRLKRTLRSADTLARLGGDEFAILQTDTRQPDGSGILATRLLSSLEDPFEVEGYSVPTGVSIGISYSADGEVDAQQMVRQADLALYAAKEEGRGRYRFHDEQMDREVRERLSLGHDLRQAVREHQMFLRFQPQIDLRNGLVSGVEALLRWNHEQRGPVRPSQFVPIAEHNGCIIEIGEWVLREAARAIKTLRIPHQSDLYVSVNISPAQMRLPDFARRLLEILEEEGLPPNALELELTERVLIHKTRQLRRSLEELHDAGVRFSVDDFGTAYSSMLYLREFSVDKLKIAHALLEHVETNEADAGIVGTLITLGHKLGLKVLAQGVERKSQLDFLKENDCTEAQGYFFSKPLPLEEVTGIVDGAMLPRLEK